MPQLEAVGAVMILLLILGSIALLGAAEIENDILDAEK